MDDTQSLRSPSPIGSSSWIGCLLYSTLVSLRWEFHYDVEVQGIMVVACYVCLSD